MSRSGGSQNLPEDERRALAFVGFDTPPGGTVTFPEVGARFGDFEIEREIGRGGAGVVYRATQRPLGRAVALKLVPEPPTALDAPRRERLEREARILASLRHDAIVTVHAAGVVPGFRYVAMDLVEGTTLRGILSAGARGWPAPGEPGRLAKALDLLHRVAGALAAAHERGIVHRDVKPENVLVDASGRPVLADFGLARDADTATVTRGFVGTPRYASPEQARGEKLSPTSDVFSFGVLAFETLTGISPFDGTTTARVLHAIEWRDPAWPGRLRVPRDVRAIVERCLEKKPSDRYPDARRVAEDLALVLRLEPVSVAPRGAVSRFARRAARRPGFTASVAVTALVVVAAVVAGVLVALENSAATRSAVGRARLEEARRLLAVGDVSREEELLVELVGSADPPPGARGLLADRKLRRAQAGEALALYRAEIDVDPASATVADRVGAHVAASFALSAVEIPPIDVSGAATARDHGLVAFLAARRGRIDEAIPALDRAIAAEPGSIEWRLDRARLLLSTRRFTRAAADFAFARDRAPLSIGDVVLFGNAFFGLARNEEAEQILASALVTAPDDIRLLARRARALQLLGRSPEGTPLMARAKALAPEDPLVLESEGFQLATTVGIDAGRDFLRAALERHPRESILRVALAQLEIEAGRFGDAIDIAEPALGDGLFGIEALGAIVRAQQKTGAFDEAMAKIPELRRRDPENASWPLQQGHLLTRAGRLDEAEIAFREAIAIGPKRADARFGLGWVLRLEGRIEEAQDQYEIARGVEPNNSQAKYWLADLFVSRGFPALALGRLSEVLTQHKTWADAWALKGVVLTELGDFVGAEEAFRTAVEFRPNHAPVIADWADMLDRNDRDVEALEQYRRARELDATLPTAYCGEGVLRLDSKDPAVRDVKEAVKLLERAVELEPDDADYRAHLERARAALRDE